MSVQDSKDIEGILKAGKLVAWIRDLLVSKAKPGISTGALDALAGKEFHKLGAISAPKAEYNFPGYTCISVNHEVAHGIPNRARFLKDGDLVNIDVSARLDGYYADTGISFVVGKPNSSLVHLCQTAKMATENAIEQAYSGNYLRNLGKAMETTAKQNGYTVIKNLAGHGTGRKLHEEPQVLVYEDKRDYRKLNEGLVLAIESFISMGAQSAYEAEDGWTLVAPKRAGGYSYVAQVEHTVIVQNGTAIVATRS